jgi:type I restriction enzyme, S subunit
MKLVKIKDTGDIISGSTPKTGKKEFWDGEINWVTPKEMGRLNGKYLLETERKITEEGFKSCSTRLIPVGNILFTSRAPIGHLAVNNIEVCTNQGFKSIILKENYSSEYIYYALKASVKKLQDLGTGSTFKELSKSKFEEFAIPVPDNISDQLHIADLLSKAENLIAQRKESLRLLDEYLKSTFLEMFGDPVRNEKGFSKVRFGDFISEIIAGSSYGGEQKEFLKDDEFGVLKVSAVTWGIFNPAEFKVVKKKDIKGKVVHPSKGDLLFSRANTRELVGATCIVDRDYPRLFLPDKLWNLKPNERELNKIFINFLFKNGSFKSILTREASGTSGSMLNISMEKLRNVKFPKPPIELQIQFAHIVEKTEALKIHYQQSLQELEHLYGSLSQKAFRGELKLDEKEEGLLMAAEPELPYQTQRQLSIPPSKKGFAKLVLAGKIISECKESLEFTNIKFQKLQHLAEHLMEADLNLNYYNQAAGPYDNKFMHTLHQKMNQQKWFASRGYKYSPMDKANEIDGHFNRYFGAGNEQFSKLITLLGKASEDQCEIISTLYAVWNDRMIKGEPITNEALIEDFFNWSERKQKYSSDQLTKAIEWMRANGLEPKGFGELIKHSKKKR